MISKAKGWLAPSWFYVTAIFLLAACSRGGTAKQDSAAAGTSADTAASVAPTAEGTSPQQAPAGTVIPANPSGQVAPTNQSGKVAPTRRRPEPAVSSTIIGRDSVINFPRRTLPPAKPQTP